MKAKKSHIKIPSSAKSSKEEYVLYILFIPKQKAFKVGITSLYRFEQRLKEIERDFGKINRGKSFFYKSLSNMDIKKTESAIHTAAWNGKKDIKKGSGKTEFIKSRHFKGVKKIINGSQEMNHMKGPFFFESGFMFPIKLFMGSIILSIGAYIFVDEKAKSICLEIIERLFTYIQTF